MKKDYRESQRVIATLEIVDNGQDFTEIDVLENGVMLGNSVIFSHGRLTIIGIGTLDGIDYTIFNDLKANMPKTADIKGQYIYFKETGEKDPLPWNAETLRYAVTKVKKAVKPNRFISAKK